MSCNGLWFAWAPGMNIRPMPMRAREPALEDEVVPEVTRLMSRVISPSDVTEAVARISSVPDEKYREVLHQLERSGALATLAGKLSENGPLRGKLLESAVARALIAEKGSPKLLVNEGDLPKSFRAVLHAENVARAALHTQATQKRLDGYCAAVAAARDAVELRALGPWVPGPPLSEPGLTLSNKGSWRFALTDSNVGLERAARAVSNRISDLRGERHAGTYGLDVSVSLAQSAAFGPVHSQTIALGVGTDGVHVRASDKVGVTAGVMGFLKTLGGPSSLVLKARELELEQERNRTQLSARVGGVGGYTVVDVQKGECGAGFIAKGGSDAVLTVKAGVSAAGMPREYGPDVFSTQAGIFGPMPEFESGQPFASLPLARQSWYARQGFTQETYERARVR